MSEKTGDPQAAMPAAAAPEAAVAALPMVEAPAISPATVSEPSSPEVAEAVEKTAPLPSAAARFRAAAAVQIADARARLEKRNASSMMAMALIAGLTGAFGTAGLSAFSKPTEQNAAHARGLEDSIARIEDELAGLRVRMEQTAQLDAAQADKTSERFARIEKAQAEPVARLSKLSEIVEKLRNASAASASVSPQASDITGSVQPPPVPMPMPMPMPVPMAKPKPAATPIVEGWTLRELDRDVALVEGKRGLFEIVVGDSIPGVGRVEGFRKQDGRWVVVTAKGLIVPQ